MDNSSELEQVVGNVLAQLGGSNQERPAQPDGAIDAQVASWIGAQVVRLLSNEGSSGLLSEVDSIVSQINGGMTQYAQLTERNADIAAALGACTCFGEIDDCEVCNGDGGPGWLLPESEMFSELILPALKRLQQRNEKRSQITYLLRD